MAVKDGLPSTDFSRMNREYIKEVAEGSAGSVLPDIAAADEGKFLGVVSGEAAWAEGGGGVENFVVTYTFDEDDEVVADKTYAQIFAAYTAGNIISARLVDSNVTFLILSSFMDLGQDEYQFVFQQNPSLVSGNSSLTINAEYIVHKNDNTIEEEYIQADVATL